MSTSRLLPAVGWSSQCIPTRCSRSSPSAPRRAICATCPRGWPARSRRLCETKGLPEYQLGSLATEHAVLGRTSSRKDLGHLTQLAFDVEYAVDSVGGWDREDLDQLNRGLRRHLRSRDKGYVVPLEAARARPGNPDHDALLAEFNAGLVGADVAQLRSIASALLNAMPDADGGPVATPAPSEVPVLRLNTSIDDADPPR